MLRVALLSRRYGGAAAVLASLLAVTAPSLAVFFALTSARGRRFHFRPACTATHSLIRHRGVPVVRQVPNGLRSERPAGRQERVDGALERSRQPHGELSLEENSCDVAMPTPPAMCVDPPAVSAYPRRLRPPVRSWIWSPCCRSASTPHQPIHGSAQPGAKSLQKNRLNRRVFRPAAVWSG
jgi:hypothetical protein